MCSSDLHDKLADFAHAQVKNRFLDAVDRCGQAVIDGIDEFQQARGEAGVAPDDLSDLGGIALLHEQKALQSLIDASEGGEGRTTRQSRLDFVHSDLTDAY